VASAHNSHVIKSMGKVGCLITLYYVFQLVMSAYIEPKADLQMQSHSVFVSLFISSRFA